MVQLPGSVPVRLANALPLGPAPAAERFEITVLLRPGTPTPPVAFDTHLSTRQYLTRERHAAMYGASEQDMDAVAGFAQRCGLTVVERNAARRSVFLSGTVAQVALAFNTSIERIEHDAGISRHRTAPIHVPAELSGIVEGVFGIEDTPIARPHFQFARDSAAAAPDGVAVVAHAAATAFTPVDVARLYAFPADVNGSGECIGIIELGGGYRSADLKTYFKGLGLATPKVTAVLVDGARNSPSQPSGADAEVALDIEIAGAVAPGAAIAVYFAPNSEQGFIDAITTAIHDTVHKPSVISISWGAPELDWTAQALSAMNSAFEAAAALGVTVCCAAGDAGSGDQNPANGTPDGLAHVDFPGSSPYVLCCGGTKLTANGKVIASETVWNDDPASSATGGGVSDVFALPSWQKDAAVPASSNPGARTGRGVPDVAGNAAPSTGYRVRVDKQNFVVGGTSAVSPLWAGLVALMNQKLRKPVGFLNPLLYGPVAGTKSFHDITKGSNGAYSATAGWDACTGWGSPHGARLLAALGG
jgi:kumamolisin